jgi:phage FluMu protein Com
MFGVQYACDQCDFDFCSGWSHHSGGQHFVCKVCVTYFVLGGGASCWRPRELELLEYIEMGDESYMPTGVRTRIRILRGPGDKKWNGVLLLAARNIRCPRCKAADALLQRFAFSAKCPRCKTGNIINNGECIY